MAEWGSNLAGYERNDQKHFNPANKRLMCATLLLAELMIYKLLNYKIASFSSSKAEKQKWETAAWVISWQN